MGRSRESAIQRLYMDLHIYSVVLRADRKKNLFNTQIDAGEASLRIGGGKVAIVVLILFFSTELFHIIRTTQMGKVTVLIRPTLRFF